MKKLFFIPLLFICTGSFAQNIDLAQKHLDAKLKEDNTKVCGTFAPVKFDDTQLSYNEITSTTYRCVRPDNSAPMFPTSQFNGEMVNKTTTYGTIGNYAVTSDYFFDDEGRYVDVASFIKKIR